MGTRKIDQDSHDVATGITLAAATMVIGLIVFGGDPATPRESRAVPAPIVSADTAVPAFDHFFRAFTPDPALGPRSNEEAR